MGSLRSLKHPDAAPLEIRGLSLVIDPVASPPRSSLEWNIRNGHVKFSVWHDHYRCPDEIRLSVYQYSAVYQARYHKIITDLQKGADLLKDWYWDLYRSFWGTRVRWWRTLAFPQNWIRDSKTYQDFGYHETDIVNVSRGEILRRKTWCNGTYVERVFPWTSNG